MTKDEMAAVATAVTRFWRNVDQRGDDDCWLWTGYVDADGYGRFFFGDRMRPAHELARTFATGEIRHPSLDTCHECNTPPCCNPGHLRFDSRRSNVHDMIKSGRANFRGQLRLSDEDVRTIRVRSAGGATGRELAALYDVSPNLICEIVAGRTRLDAGGPIRTSHGNAKRKEFSYGK